jgi:uncharacterized SAM-binding protein YcdF (DUF218 family)
MSNLAEMRFLPSSAYSREIVPAGSSHWLKRLIAFAMTGFCFFLIGGCAMFRPSSVRLFKKAQTFKTFDAIIVPGVPFRNGNWDSIMKARVLWSWFLYQKGMATNIIYSGSAVYSPYVEGKTMALYAEALGIPKEHIFVEDQAEHSTENVYYSYKLAKEKGFKSLALATDPYQASLLYGFTKKRFRSPIIHIPIIFDTIRKINYMNPVIDPQSAFVKDWTSILVRQTRHYRFRGTRGKNIPFKKRKMDAL